MRKLFDEKVKVDLWLSLGFSEGLFLQTDLQDRKETGSNRLSI